VQSIAAADRRRTRLDESALSTSTISGIGAKLINAHPDTVLIHTVVLPEALYIFWISKSGIANSIKVAVAEKDLDATISAFRQNMRDCQLGGCNTAPAQRDIQILSQKLYGWLMPQSLRDELQKNNTQNLFFSLDRNIRYIPMAALFDGNQYLIEQYTISTLTSVEATASDNAFPSNPSVLALGLSEAVPANPVANMPAFAPLPQVPAELNEIVRNSQAADPTGIYPGIEQLNAQFNAKAFSLARDRQILHIATHGVFSPVSRNASYLMLGTKIPWRIADIQNQQPFFTHLRLIVLSACETGLGGTQVSPDLPIGTTADGREISAIAQTFVDVSGGKATLVASLWQVNDQSTRELMQRFYQNLAHSALHTSIAHALQTTQVSFLQDQKFSHPYYWSPFVIIGNGL
jgi:CHAT domain-containing protein